MPAIAGLNRLGYLSQKMIVYSLVNIRADWGPLINTPQLPYFFSFLHAKRDKHNAFPDQSY